MTPEPPWIVSARLREQSIPTELVERALHDPILYAALRRYVSGDWTLLYALQQAVLVLSTRVEAAAFDPHVAVMVISII